MRPDSIRDPFLRAIDDVVFSVFRLYCSSSDIGDITSSAGLSDCDADPLFAGEELGNEFLLQCLRSKLQDWRETKSHSHSHSS